jgi:hypothetical protein
MKKYILLSFTIITAFMSSCKKETPPSDFYAEYEISYNENTNKTTVSAVFKEKNAFGANVQLANASDISFEGNNLDWDNFSSYYTKEFTGNVGSGNFKFKDNADKVHNNYVLLVAAIGYSAYDTIHTTSNFNYQWLGLANDAKQKVALYMDGVSLTNLPLYYENNASGGNSITLLATQLQTQGVGSAGCIMERSYYDNATDITSGGGIVKSKYIALNKVIYLKP